MISFSGGSIWAVVKGEGEGGVWGCEVGGVLPIGVCKGGMRRYSSSEELKCGRFVASGFWVSEGFRF